MTKFFYNRYGVIDIVPYCGLRLRGSLQSNSHVGLAVLDFIYTATFLFGLEVLDMGQLIAASAQEIK